VARANPPRRRTLAAVVLLALLVLALATSRGGERRLYPAQGDTAVSLYLVDNGFHSDLAVPRALLIAHGGPTARAAALASPQPWMLVGWGDAKFYEADGFSADRAVDALRALFAPNNPSVVHLQGFRGDPPAVWQANVRRIRVSPAGLEALMTRLDRSFRTRPDGGPIVVPVRRVPEEAFFESVETFSLTHLCHHWTAELLNAAGLPVTPVIDTLPFGLGLDLKLRAGV